MLFLPTPSISPTTHQSLAIGAGLVNEVQTQGMDCFSFKQPYPKVHNPKRIIKFMVSFSLFCVIFSLLPLRLQSFKPFLMQFFTYIIDKSYMFLLCNGLLVFIAINSGLIDFSSPSTHQSIQVAVDSEKNSRLEEFKVLEIAAPIEAENVMEIEYPQAEERSLMIEGQEGEDGLSDTREGEEEGNALMVIDEDEHAAGEEEGNALVSIEEDEHAAGDTEELNKKCEDFIRKMKAAFCSEPRAYPYSWDFDSQKSLVAVKC